MMTEIRVHKKCNQATMQDHGDDINLRTVKQNEIATCYSSETAPAGHNNNEIPERNLYFHSNRANFFLLDDITFIKDIGYHLYL